MAAGAWICMGAVRANLSWDWADENIATLQVKAKDVNTQLTKRLSQAGLSEEAQALCAAITLGNKAYLQRSTRQLFATAGASHLLAISGLHVGLLFLLITKFFNIIFFWWRNKQWCIHLQTFLSIISIGGYAFITGLQPSVVRSCIMLTILLLSLHSIHQEVMAFRRLILSVFIMIWLSPAYLYQLGFWLSILAVSGIILLYMPCINTYRLFTKNSSSRRTRILAYIGSTICISFAAQVFVAPLCMYYFHNLPLLGPLWSLVLIPLCTLLLYISILTVAFPFSLLGKALNLIVCTINGFLQSVADIPNLVIENLYPNALIVALLYALLTVLTFRLHQHLQKRQEEIKPHSHQH